MTRQTPVDPNRVLWIIFSIRLDFVIMNNKLLLIPIVSLGAIVQSPQSASAETLSAPALPNPETQLKVSEMAGSSSIDRIASVSTPELTTTPLTTTPQPEVPQIATPVTPEVSSQVAVVETPQVAAPVAEPVTEKPLAQSLTTSPDVVATDVVAADIVASNASIVAQASRSAGVTTTVPVKIEVGSRGIPPITDLPARISLPPSGLLPGNFEYPMNLGQTIDGSVATSSPITDRFADPALSEHLQDVQTFLATKPEPFTIPCASLPTADCSPMMKPVNLDAYKAKGLSLKGQDPAANPNSPSAIGPVVRERLRMTVEEVQAYRTAYSQNLTAWSDRVSQCMAEKPRMYVLRSDGAQLPVFFNGQEGTIVRNSAGQAVCTN